MKKLLIGILLAWSGFGVAMAQSTTFHSTTATTQVNADNTQIRWLCGGYIFNPYVNILNDILTGNHRYTGFDTLNYVTVTGPVNLGSQYLYWHNQAVASSPCNSCSWNQVLMMQKGTGDAVGVIPVDDLFGPYLASYMPHLSGISQLQSYTGAATTVYVDTAYRGGVFKLVPTTGLSIDNGMVFNSTFIGYYWQRQIPLSSVVKVEWWPMVKGGIVDNTASLQAAVNYAATAPSRKLDLSQPGTFLTGRIVWKSGVSFTMGSNLSYNSNLSNPCDSTVLKANTALSPTCIIDISGKQNTGFYGVVIDGARSDSTLVTSGILGSSTTISSIISQCKGYNCNHGLDGGGGSVYMVTDCIFRENNVNIYNLQDSKVIDCTLVGGRSQSVYMNTGQWQIIGCHIEFSRTGAARTSKATGIYIDGNANRFLIQDCTFDRNAGNDIWITTLASKQPYSGQIQNNQLKRAAWGTDINTPPENASIRLLGGKDIAIEGNQFYAYDYAASQTEGVFSPLYNIYSQNVTGLTMIGNKIGAKQKIDLQGLPAGAVTGSNKYTWVASGSGTANYYLKMTTSGPTDTNPWIGQPTFTEYNRAYLTSGTPGSLTAGQSGWGDADGIGWNTLYVRLAADRNPNTVGVDTLLAEYQQPAIFYDNSNSNVETDVYNDINQSITLNAGATVTIPFRTKNALLNNSIPNFVTLQVQGREVTAGTKNMSNVSWYVNKTGSGTYPTLTNAGVINYVNGFSTAQSGASGLVATLNSMDGLGDKLYITFTNNESNQVIFSAGLLKSPTSAPTSIPTTALTGTLQAAQIPALTGDVSNSAGSATVSIGSGKVTYSKIQAVTTNKLLGSGSGTATAEITLGAGFSFSSSTLNYSAPNIAHTIFTPTTGQTITLINNQRNLISPAGTLATLTVTLPASPANNDVVYITFTKAVTTVTYAGGTVVGGLTSPTVESYEVLTYDSGTTSWY